MSGRFLRTVLDGGPDALAAQILSWLDQIAAILTVLGARTPGEAADCDVRIVGGLREFCEDRGIDLRRCGSPRRRHRTETGECA